MRTVRCERSLSGLMVLRESGGGSANTGNATVIADKSGRPMRPLFVPRKVIAYGDGVGYVARPGMLVVTADRYHDEVRVIVERVITVNDRTGEVGLEIERAYKARIEELTEPAAIAAAARSDCYHCRCVTHFPQ